MNDLNLFSNNTFWNTKPLIVAKLLYLVLREKFEKDLRTKGWKDYAIPAVSPNWHFQALKSLSMPPQLVLIIQFVALLFLSFTAVYQVNQHKITHNFACLASSFTSLLFAFVMVTWTEKIDNDSFQRSNHRVSSRFMQMFISFTPLQTKSFWQAIWAQESSCNWKRWRILWISFIAIPFFRFDNF